MKNFHLNNTSGILNRTAGILLFAAVLLISFKSYGQSNNCTTATQITLTNGAACVNGTNAGAITDNTLYGGCNAAPVDMVWYTYVTNGSTNSFTVTPGTLTDAEIVIYTGACPLAGTLETCTTASGSNPINTSWGLVAGQQVWLGIASTSLNDGTFQLCVNSQPPAPGAGNTCSQAIPLCNFTSFTKNPIASNSSGQTPTCFLSAPQQDIWYQFTITQAGTLAWTATPTNLAAEFDWCLWDISAGCPGTVTCCNYHFANGSSNGFGMQSVVQNAACGITSLGGSANKEYCAPIAVTCGKTYAIQISNYSNDNSGFTMAFTNSTCAISANAAFSVSPTVLCAGSLTAAITNTSTGTCAEVWSFGDGSPNYTGATPPNHVYSSPGTYAITASIGGVCPSGATQFVQLLAPLAATASASPTACSGPCSGTANVTSVSGGDGVYTYSWNPGGATTSSVSGLCAGNYTVTVSNAACGSSVTQSVTVTGTSAPTATITSLASLNCSNPSVVLDGSGSSSGANITYSWSTVGGNIVSGGTTTQPTVNAAGIYTILVTDIVSGCSSTYSVSVAGSTAVPNANAGSDMSLTCNTANVNLSGSSSTGGATFSWSGPGIVSGGGTASPNVNATGNYTVTVTDPSNGCTSTDVASVTLNNTPPNVNAGLDQTLTCALASVTLTGSSSTGGSTFNWSGPGGASGSSATLSASTIGTYTLTVTDPSNGCTATDNVDVIPDSNLPNANAGSPQTITCTTTTITLSGSSSTAGATFSWGGPGVVSGGGSATATANVSGTYTLTVTDPGNGCTNTSQVVVNLNNTIPNADAGLDQVETCTTASATLSGSSSTAGATFGWSGPGAFSGSTSSVTVTSTGTYTLTTTDPGNGCTNIDSALVTINNTPPDANAGPDQTFSCAVQSATLSGSSITPAATFSWSGPSGFSSSSQNPTVTNVGTYTITVTDPSNGCTAIDTANVTQTAALPNANAGAPQTLTCATTTVTLNGSSSTGGATFSWSGPGGFSSATASASVSLNGTYTITVTDPSSGCSNIDSVVVSTNTVTPNVNAGSAQTITCTANTVTLSGSSSTAGATFGWSGPGGFSGATAVVTANTAGTYTLTITDPANGCTSTGTVVVSTNTTPPNANAGTNQTVTCATTTVTISGSSSTAGVSFGWAGPGGFSSASQNPTASTAGIYTLTVTDPSNGCTNTATVSVLSNTTPPSATGTASSPAITCNTSSVSLTGTTGAASATITWAGSGGPLAGNPATVSTSGTYTVTVIDNSNGCSNTATVTVLNLTVPPVAAASTPNDSLNCASPTTTLNGTGNQPGVTFAWAGPGGYNSTQQNPSGISTTGVYTVTVTNPATGCSSTATVTIYQGSDPVAGFTASPVSGVVPLPVSFTNSSVGATTYNWNFGDANTSSSVNPSNTYLATGTYTVVLIASNGTAACNDTATTVIVVFDQATLIIPNVFTPNGDGVNELFQVTSTGFSEMTIEIFNRWGNQLSSFNGLGGYWDGSGATDGTYYFMLKGKTIDKKEKEQHGYFLLAR